MKKTKIISTLGPSTCSEKTIMDMANSGMNIARINMSHTNSKKFFEYTKIIKKVNKKIKFPIPILFDSQGTDVRIQELKTSLRIKKGEMIEIGMDKNHNSKFKNFTININIFKGLKKGMGVTIDDGKIEIIAEKIYNNRGIFKVITSGIIKSRKSINCPDCDIDFEGITPEDYKQIKFALKNGADIITLSFVRSKKDVFKIRKLIEKVKLKTPIISKIEDKIGLKNIDEIIDASDGIMIARGDLGADVAIEDIPFVQKKIIDKCILNGKPVVVATQMMESMIENPNPTRAEVSDISTAVLQKTDLIMLSAETSIGEYPIRCVQKMTRICERSEIENDFDFEKCSISNKDIREEITLSSSRLASDIGATAIIVFTKTGQLARLISKNRPTTPIFAFTEDENVQKSLVLSYGVIPYKTKLNNIHGNTKKAIKELKNDGFIKKNDFVIIISDVFKNHENSQLIELKRI